MSVTAADIVTDGTTGCATLFSFFFSCLKLLFLWGANTLSSVRASSEFRVVVAEYLILSPGSHRWGNLPG